jgi:hypothetical protein
MAAQALGHVRFVADILAGNQKTHSNVRLLNLGQSLLL